MNFHNLYVMMKMMIEDVMNNNILKCEVKRAGKCAFCACQVELS